MVVEILLLVAAVCSIVAIVLLCRRNYIREEAHDGYESEVRRLSHHEVAKKVATTDREWHRKGAYSGAITALESGPDGDRIVLRAVTGDSAQVRWIVIYHNGRPYQLDGEQGIALFCLWMALCRQLGVPTHV